jgi:hypothetical protein
LSTSRCKWLITFNYPIDTIQKCVFARARTRRDIEILLPLEVGELEIPDGDCDRPDDDEL